MAINQQITWALQEAEQRILTALQDGGADGWVSVFDEDGNPNLPTTERQVLVFLCGDRKLTDPRPSDDAGHGLRLGYFDHDKQYWRVHGRSERYVTHWRECPDDPLIPENQNEQQTQS